VQLNVTAGYDLSSKASARKHKFDHSHDWEQRHRIAQQRVTKLLAKIETINARAGLVSSSFWCNRR
jgi:hypothetical protein